MYGFLLWIAGLVGWVCFIAGFCLIGTRLEAAKKRKNPLWNGRIDKLGKIPFSFFLRVYWRKTLLEVLFDGAGLQPAGTYRPVPVRIDQDRNCKEYLA